MDAGTVYLIAGTVTFAFTTVLTIAGVGAAFILIPVFLSLGIGLHTAMATALLLNALAMFFACLRFVPAGMVDFRAAMPILIVATVLSPLGAWSSAYLPIPLLKGLFVGFLLFAASMMLFYRAKPMRPGLPPGKPRGTARPSVAPRAMSAASSGSEAAISSFRRWYGSGSIPRKRPPLPHSS
jgi:uncharacterized membrane protein YfcA